MQECAAGKLPFLSIYQNSIRESGCPSEITRQIQKYCKSFVDGDSGTESLLVSTCQVLTNLSMDPKTQQELGVDSIKHLGYSRSKLYFLNCLILTQNFKLTV